MNTGRHRRAYTVYRASRVRLLTTTSAAFAVGALGASCLLGGSSSTQATSLAAANLSATLAASSAPGASPAEGHSPRLEQELAGPLTGTGVARPGSAAGKSTSMAQATTPAASTLVNGVDVASFQHPNGAPIDWTQVAAAGYQFALIKATEGNYYTNPFYASDATQAVAAGMYVSAYEFANPADSSGAAAADYSWQNAGNYKVGGRDLPLMLDLEYNPYKTVANGDECYGLTPAQMVTWISDFMTEATRLTGATPVIYTPTDWWDLCTGNSAAFGRDLLWIPSYSSATPSTFPAGWSNWTFWQYTSVGSVTGITGNVDLDYFNGSLGTLSALATPASYRTVTVMPVDAGGGTSGGFAAWAVDSSGTLWNGLQSSPGSAWRWTALGGGFQGTAAVEPVKAGGGTSGGFALWIVDSSGNLWNGWQTSPGSAWNWAKLGSGFQGTPAVVSADAGGLTSGGFAVMAVDIHGNLWTGWQTSTGSAWKWATLASGFQGTPALVPADAGGLTTGGFAVLAVGTNGNLWTGWQTSAGSAWKWAVLASGFQGTPALVPINAGGLTTGGFAVLAVDTSGNLWNGWQTRPGSTWKWAVLASGFQGTKAVTIMPVNAGGSTSGGFSIWLIDGTGRLMNGLQSSAGSAWTWTTLNTGMQGLPAAEPVNAGGGTTGGFALWAIDSGGSLWNGLQSSPGSAWTWTNLGLPGG